MLDIGLEIRLLRERLKIPAKELAQAVGLSQSQMSRLEKGQRRVDARLLEKIARALNVDPSYFFRDARDGGSKYFRYPVVAPVGKVIRAERRRRHIAAEDLASRLGISKAMLLAIEEGRRELSPELGERILKALRLPPSYFLGVQQEAIHRLQDRVAELEGALAGRGDAATASGGMRPVPLLESLPGGYPEGVSEEGIPPGKAESYVVIPDLPARPAFGVRVVGDSMESPYPPSFREGDVVVFAKAPLRSRDFAYVCLQEGAPLFRQVFFEEGGEVRLQPLNLNYPPLTLSREDVRAFWRLVAHATLF